MTTNGVKLGIGIGVVVVGGALVARLAEAQVAVKPTARPAPTMSPAGTFARITKIEPNMPRPSALAKATPQVKPEAAPDAAAQPTTAPRPKTIANSCDPAHLKLRWPLDGQAGRVWGINHYTDLDTYNYTRRDFRGATSDNAITYDGHRGYDILVGSFRQMDQDAVLARAAAAGKVVVVEDGRFDRETTTTPSKGMGNHVAIQHANGFISYYAHLKKNSLKVTKGQFVEAGTPLGVVGSSGCSSAPHLHFELHDCDNKWIEPANVQGMWPVHLGTLEQSGVMDLVLTEGLATEAQVLDPPSANIAALKKGQRLGIAMTAMLRGGDDVLVGVLGAGNDIREEWTATGKYGGQRLRFVATIAEGPGLVTVGVWVNGTLRETRPVMIVP